MALLWVQQPYLIIFLLNSSDSPAKYFIWLFKAELLTYRWPSYYSNYFPKTVSISVQRGSPFIQFSLPCAVAIRLTFFPYHIAGTCAHPDSHDASISTAHLPYQVQQYDVDGFRIDLESSYGNAPLWQTARQIILEATGKQVTRHLLV